MIDYVGLYPNKYVGEFNDDIIVGNQDDSLEDFIITSMKELEAIENIEILDIEVVDRPDDVDINMHTININYKKKDLSNLEFPKFKYMNDNFYGEIIFTIKVETNLNKKIIKKHILYPIEIDGFYYNNGKKMKAIWQLLDASTYSQRGKTTIKSRMPIVIYQNKSRMVEDVTGTTHVTPSYSYALNTKNRKPGAKSKPRFINPILIYSAKMGLANTLKFFDMEGIVFIDSDYKESELDKYEIFQLDELYVKVKSDMFEKYNMVRAFVAMLCSTRNKDFPVSSHNIEDKEYWICRIGMVGTAKNKNIFSFREKGYTTLLMIERLLDQVTINNLRLPIYYKQNIYYLMYWIMTNFEELRAHSNIDMCNKRIRRNEYIVLSSLGKKINENINKFIEKRGKSRMNTMDTLMELFNFPSDIIISGMRNLNDLVKTDDIVNDMNFLMDIAYSGKGFQSIGDSNNKKISVKYRYLHPSMVGILDLNVSSNSDVGMSGSLVPFAKLYDRFYFTPDREPCQNQYLFEVETKKTKKKSFDSWIASKYKDDPFKEYLKYEKIEIVEKESTNILTSMNEEDN